MATTTLNAEGPGQAEGEACAFESLADEINQWSIDRINIFLSAGAKWRFAESIKSISEDTAQEYEGRTLLELLQNGHDAMEESSPGRVRFILQLDGDVRALYAANDGRPFNTSNFQAITELALSNKGAGEGIGNKGLGFRSVLQLTDSPEIYSRHPVTPGDRFDGYSFRFAQPVDVLALVGDKALADKVVAAVSSLQLPVAADSTDSTIDALCAEGFSTVVHIPLRNDAAVDEATRQVQALLSHDRPLLLFLRRIAAVEVTVRTTTTTEHTVLSRSETPCRTLGGAEAWVSEVDLGPQGHFICARRELEPSLVKDAIELSIEGHQIDHRWRDWNGEGWVGLAWPTAGDLDRGHLYTFLPMASDALAPLAAHVHAPFFTKLARLAISETVPLNSFLLDEVANLTLDLLRAFRDTGDRDTAGPLVVDLAAWATPHRLAAAIERDGGTIAQEKLIPLARSTTWGCLDETYIWDLGGTKGWKVLTVQALMAIGAVLADPGLGPKRLTRLNALHTSVIGWDMEPGDDEVSQWCERVAAQLHKKAATPGRWAEFYDELALALTSGAGLRGRRIIVDDDGALQLALGSNDEKNRRHAIFFAPDDSDNPIKVRVPRGLRRRLVFASQSVPWRSTDPSRPLRPGRRFLEANALVREYRSERILDAMQDFLASSPSDPTKRDVLELGYRLYPTLTPALRTRLPELGFSVPLATGTWTKAANALLPIGWSSNEATLLQRLLDLTDKTAPGLESLKQRLISEPTKFAVSVDDVDRWTEYLLAVGVQTGLPIVHPSPVIANQQGNTIDPTAIATRTGLDHSLRTAWIAAVRRVWTGGSHPYTRYWASHPVPILPGADSLDSLTDEARRIYSRLVLEGMARWTDEAYEVTLSRRGRPTTAMDPYRIPTPIATFVRQMPWFPLAGVDLDGRTTFTSLGQLWFGGRTELPAFVRALPGDIREAMDALPVRRRLEATGLRRWSDSQRSTEKLIYMAALVANGELPGHQMAQLKNAYELAWHELSQTPAAAPAVTAIKQLVVATGADVGVLDTSFEALVHVIDEDDPTKRLLLEVLRRPLLVNDGRDGVSIHGWLGRHRVGAVLTSTVVIAVYADGKRVTPDATSPTLAEEAAWFATLIGLVLTLRPDGDQRLGDQRRQQALDRFRLIRVVRAEQLELEVDADRIPSPVSVRSIPLADDRLPTVVVRAGDSAWFEWQSSAGSVMRLLGLSTYSERLELALVRLAERYGSDVPDLIDDDAFAIALAVSEDRVAEVRSGLRSPVQPIIETLRPFILMRYGLTALDDFDHRTDDARTESDVTSAFEALAVATSDDVRDLVELCRPPNNLVQIRDATGADFVAFNVALSQIGPPYRVVEHPEIHRQAFEEFVEIHQDAIVDRLREAWSTVAADHGDLTDYVAARSLSDLEADPAWLPLFRRPPEELIQQRVEGWLRDHGAEPGLGPSRLETLSLLRQHNQLAVESTARTADSIVRTWCHLNGPLLPKPWDAPASMQLRSGLERSGRGDFHRFTDDDALQMVADILGWPSGMTTTTDLEVLGITASQLMTREQIANAATTSSTTRRNVVNVGTQEIPAGRQHFEALIQAVTAATPDSLIRQRGRVALAEQPPPSKRPPTGGSGGSFVVLDRNTGLTDDQKSSIGLAGEIIAKLWLEHRHPDVRWRSGYRNIVLGDDEGSDDLGYDFEVPRSTGSLFYEVKATNEISAGRFEFEMSSGEIRLAQEMSRNDRYRVLVIAGALEPDSANIIELPNPLGRKSSPFFRSVGKGVRFRCAIA